MKNKKVLGILAWSVIASMAITACAENADKKNKKDDEEETSPALTIDFEGETVQTEQTATAETIEETAATTAPEPIDYSYEQAYLNTIDNIKNYTIVSTTKEQCKYDLIYLDNDNIPELVVEIGVCNVNLFTYANGEVHQVMKDYSYGAGGNQGYEYAPGSGLIVNYNLDYAGASMFTWYGKMGENYELEGDGVSRCSQIFPQDTADPWAYIGKIESYENAPMYYYVDNTEVTVEEFNNACYPEYQEWYFIDGKYSLDEITYYLTNEKTPALESDASYEIIVQDCTWSEAEAICESKGGHLATFIGETEYYSLCTFISENKSDAFAFYVGGSYSEAEGRYLMTVDGSNMPVGDYWRDGEPTLTGKTEDGRTVTENKLCLLLTNDNGYTTYQLIDVPDDILDAAPSYSGKVAFICQYD